MSNINRDNGLDKLMFFFVVSMSVVMLVSIGADLHTRDYFRVATSAISVVFFIGLSWLLIATRIRDLKDQVEAERRTADSLRANGQNLVAPAPAKPQMPAELKELLDEVVKPILEDVKEHQHDHEMLGAILADMGVGPDDVPTPEQLEQVKVAFHENTDRYIDFTPTDDGKYVVEFSDKPIEHVPGRSAAHEEARIRGDKARAGKSVNGVEKRRETPSQQRKRNAKAGKGEFTDDELREQRNAKRRADRAAKKAEQEGGTTTTTTTQPGQTSLV